MKFPWMFGLALEVIAAQGENPVKGLSQPRRKSLFGSENLPPNGISVENLTLMKFILDFASRSRWESIVFFFSNSSDIPSVITPPRIFRMYQRLPHFQHGHHHPERPELKETLHLREGNASPERRKCEKVVMAMLKMGETLVHAKNTRRCNNRRYVYNIFKFNFECRGNFLFIIRNLYGEDIKNKVRRGVITEGFYSSLPPLIFNYFNGEGKFIAIHATSQPLLPGSVLHRGHHLGIVYFYDVIDENFLNRVSELDLFDSYRSWLIIKSDNSARKLNEVLPELNIGLVTNLVVATLDRRTISSTTAGTPSTVATSSDLLIGYRKRQIEEDICVERSKRDLPSDPNLVVRICQIYKASMSENETISVKLGSWDVPNGMFKAKHPIYPEKRWDMGGYKILVGVKNSSQEVVGNLIADRFSFESEVDEESRFMELFDCLMFGMNASFEVVQFQKLGWRNEEGGWTHLLGAVVDGTVDFALETINPNSDKAQDMSFTYAIVITMNNIYFRRPKSTGLRDIFLAPFSPRLLLCVFTTGLLLAIAMISITIVNYHIVEAKKPRSELQIITKGKREKTVVVVNREERKWELSEAALWSVSILCMQGSQWSPKSVSGSLLLINSLLFALIIYNSFAAFITSVLSVKDVKIKNLKDLAESEFAFGYTLGDADELFLRTVNDTLLRELYFKGLRENEGVSNPIAGMKQAAKGKYAFFVGARTARRALQTVIAYNRRCELQELYLSVTKTFASIPVTRRSSLKKILNYKIIRLMESGILHRFQKLILPSMPRCVEKTAFNSARLTDVYSAFFVLVVGWIASVLILLAEIVWYQRKKIRKTTYQEHLKYNNFVTAEGLHWFK